MQRSVKAVLVIIVSVMVFFTGFFVNSFLTSSPSKDYKSDSQVNTSKSLALHVPPAQAIEATASTPPLNTSAISLIAYFYQVGGWTLADAVPAFITHFDGGNYYDGIVRVWDTGVIGAVSSDSSDSYVDVNVRIRADGWILAWFNQSADSGAIVWWGHDRTNTGSPPVYSTTLSRSIAVVYSVVGSAAFPGYDSIGMYDYSEPLSTRLLVFGQSLGVQGAIYYYTIPANSTMVPNKLLIRAGGGGLPSVSDYGTDSLQVDGVPIYARWGSIWGWSTFEIDDYAKGIQHSVVQSTPGYFSIPYGNSYYPLQSVAFIMWSG